MKRADGTTKSFRVLVTNTYVPMLEWCKRVTGIGSVLLKASNPGFKNCYSWETYGVKAASVLKYTIPYMQIKQKKAREVMREMLP